VPRRKPPARSKTPWLVVGIVGLLVVGGTVGGTLFAFRDKLSPVPKVSLAEPAKGAKDESSAATPSTNPKAAPEVPARVEDSLSSRVLALFNDQRKRERLAPVKLDDDACNRCAKHAAHLVEQSAVADLDPHEADGKSASVVYQEPLASLKAWLQAPAHRAFLMDPELTAIAFGAARTKADGWVSAFDWVSGRPPVAARQTDDPILYPSPGQGGVALSFPGNEIPDPLPNATDKLAGFPITVTFPGPARIPDSRAWMEDEAGNEVPVWFSSPTKPANDRYTSLQQNTLCVFAKQVLRPGMRYIIKVEARVGARDWSRAWTFTTEPPAESRRRIYERAVARLNEFRKAAGLPPVALDPEASLACLAHSGYLARHFERAEGVDRKDELPELSGFTEAGQKVARRSTFRLGGGTHPRDAVDWMLASVVMRHGALNPSVKTVGLGAAQQAPRGWLWTIALPLQIDAADFPGAILYPGKEQTDVPLLFGREVASLVPGEKADAVAGYPVTANFFPRRRVRAVKASLSEAGTEVPCWLSSPEKRLPGTGGNAQILLVPKQALKSATKYAVEMSAEVDGEPWSAKWQFTTTDTKAYRDRIAEGLLAEVNRARKIAGLSAVVLDDKLSGPCQKHADYVARNLDHPKVQGLGIHDEEATLPGATPEGAKAGKAAVIAIISEPADSVAGWMATLYHRLPILEPGLKRVGYGQTQHPIRGWVTVLDTGNGR
jgi:uncharacterized protein YkwD